MRRPSIFISSTCYDLKQLRADLHSYVEQAGFEPVLSEYPTFPVDPDETAIENCRKMVESRADIFVLVVGGRYGSLTEQGKSVTNLEYLSARASTAGNESHGGLQVVVVPKLTLCETTRRKS